MMVELRAEPAQMVLEGAPWPELCQQVPGVLRQVQLALREALPVEPTLQLQPHVLHAAQSRCMCSLHRPDHRMEHEQTLHQQPSEVHQIQELQVDKPVADRIRPMHLDQTSSYWRGTP